MSETEDFLRRLAANDERCLQSLLAPEVGDAPVAPVLDRRTRALVRLTALLAVDAPTPSVRWAAEMASTTGAGDAALIQVLLSAAAAAGAAQTVTSAPRLALALDLDIEVEGWDGS